jgi:hypothetical protein
MRTEGEGLLFFGCRFVFNYIQFLLLDVKWLSVRNMPLEAVLKAFKQFECCIGHDFVLQTLPCKQISSTLSRQLIASLD